jgi:hypothetical protein
LSKESNRGDNDWEILKMILDANPALKQRVLYKLKSLRAKTADHKKPRALVSDDAQKAARSEEKALAKERSGKKN